MIVGIGVDLVALARIRGVHQRHGQRFLERVYVEDERRHALAAADPTERLAGGWAAKEAVMKALGTGASRGVTFASVEIRNDPLGKPCVVLHGRAAERAADLGIARWHVSITHSDGVAVAMAVAEGAAVPGP